jgi:hypothetical protein
MSLMQRGRLPSVQRLDRPSPVTFFENFYHWNRPVVMSGLLSNWKALNLWSLEYFGERFGDVQVTFSAERSTHALYEETIETHMKQGPLRTFIETCKQAPTNSVYIVAKNHLLNSPELRPALSDLGMLDGFVTDVVPHLWLGGAGTITTLHHDACPILFAQIFGRKEVRLISCFELARMRNDRSCYSTVDINDTEYFKSAQIAISKVFLGPGDVLFIPLGYWHHVTSTTESGSLSFTRFCAPQASWDIEEERELEAGVRHAPSDMANLDADVVLRFARAVLTNIATTTSPRIPSAIPPTPCLRVNATLRRNGKVIGSMSGNGNSMGAQIADAVHRAASDRRFGGVGANKSDICVELWFQTGASSIPVESRANYDFAMDFEGVEIRHDKKHAYYKPSVRITSRFDTNCQMFERLCEKAGLARDAWTLPQVDVWATSWVHLAESSPSPPHYGGYMRGLRRTRVDAPELATIGRWFSDGVSYLTTHQKRVGEYIYRTQPLCAQRNVATQTHLVRQAGCAYAVLAAAASDLLPAFLRTAAIESGTSAVEFLLRRISFDGGAAFIAERDAYEWGKLGSVALVLGAMSVSPTRADFVSVRSLFLQTILSAVHESGRLTCRFGVPDDNDRDQEFYPGQAILALVLSDSAHLIQSLDRVFSFYSDWFYKRPSTAFALWQVDAWSRLATSSGREDFGKLVFDIVDWLLAFQRHDPAGESHGGFKDAPDASTFVYAEAVARGALLAKTFGHHERSHRYRRALQHALRFCAKLVIGPEHRPYLRSDDALGGVTENPRSFRVRCDHVQHMITMTMLVSKNGELLEN